MQLLETLVLEEGYDNQEDAMTECCQNAAMESMVLLEGLDSKDVPESYRKEVKKLFDELYKWAKADDVKKNNKTQVKADKKLKKLSRVYSLPILTCSDTVDAEKVSAKLKSMGYKKSVNEDKAVNGMNNTYYIKKLGNDGYINPIVTTKKKTNQFVVVCNFVFAEKIKDDQLDLFK